MILLKAAKSLVSNPDKRILIGQKDEQATIRAHNFFNNNAGQTSGIASQDYYEQLMITWFDVDFH